PANRPKRITDGRFLQYCAEVAVRTAELDIERTGCRGLRDAAVWGGVVVAVAKHNLPCAGHTKADQTRNKHHQCAGKPCRKPVHQIVEPGGSPSELQVTLVFVPDHRVESIYR